MILYQVLQGSGRPGTLNSAIPSVMIIARLISMTFRKSSLIIKFSSRTSEMAAAEVNSHTQSLSNIPIEISVCQLMEAALNKVTGDSIGVTFVNKHAQPPDPVIRIMISPQNA